MGGFVTFGGWTQTERFSREFWELGRTGRSPEWSAGTDFRLDLRNRNGGVSCALLGVPCADGDDRSPLGVGGEEDALRAESDGPDGFQIGVPGFHSGGEIGRSRLRGVSMNLVVLFTMREELANLLRGEGSLQNEKLVEAPGPVLLLEAVGGIRIADEERAVAVDLLQVLVGILQTAIDPELAVGAFLDHHGVVPFAVAVVMAVVLESFAAALVGEERQGAGRPQAEVEVVIHDGLVDDLLPVAAAVVAPAVIQEPHTDGVILPCGQPGDRP